MVNKKEDWPNRGVIDEVREFGANHIECGVREIIVDRENKIVTTPA